MESKFQQYQCKNVVASGHTTVNLSRLSLLKWVNDLVGAKIQKVEALCSGFVYCQIMDMLFPGCIPLKKVKFEASLTTEYWSNFKQLQMGFRAIGCEKEIPIDTIIKGRFQDNFEFLQWFKRFYDENVDQSLASEIKSEPQSSSKVQHRYAAPTNPKYNQAEREVKSQLEEYRGRMTKVMEEKDFYFNKLRNIEIMCSSEDAINTEKEALVKKILDELYATAEGFEPPEEE